MITGMTGFGASEITTPNLKGTVEIKSVNHRYFDISYYIPTGFGSVEERVRKIVQEKVKRGKVTVAVKINQKAVQTGSLNHVAVKRYLEVAKLLEKNYGLSNQLTVSDLLRLPGVIDVQDQTIDVEEVWPLVEKALQKALRSLVLMREREGRTLAKDMTDKLKIMSSEIVRIRQRDNFQISFGKFI